MIIELLPSHTAEQLCSSLTKVIEIYWQEDYAIHNVLMDTELEKLVDMMDELVIKMNAV